jgi:hypothetical protein
LCELVRGGTPGETCSTEEEEKRMRKLVLLLALASAFVFAGAALAVESYGGPRYWYPGEGAGSSYQSGWNRNAFNKSTSGYDTTVTFIDNRGYGWHATVRNTDTVTYTYWWSSEVKRAHCRANSGYHWGGCHVS